MQIQISKKDILWSYLGYFLKLGSNIIILPMVLNFLAEEELGIWYVFLSIGGLVTLLDFGFSPTIMRNITYCWSGAKELIKEGIIIRDKQEATQPNYEMLYELFKISRKMYLIISLVALGLMLTLGTIYIYSLVYALESTQSMLIAWIIFCIGTFSNLFYSYWTPMLCGIGLIKKMQIANIVSHVTYILIVVFGLLFGFGLIAIAIGFLINGLLLRQVAKKFFVEEKNIKNEFYSFKRKGFSGGINLFPVIWHNASKLGIVSIGTFFTLQANTLICSSFIDLSTTAKYGLSLQVFQMIASMSRIPFVSLLPEFSVLRVNNELNKLKERFSLTVVLFWMSYVVAGLFVILFGDHLLALIGSHTTFLGKPHLLLMFLYLFLEFNHTNFATLITTKNEIPFVMPALVSGILIVFLALVFVIPLKLGVLGLMVAQTVIQLCYNNWIWPLKVFKELNINLSKIMEMGLGQMVKSATGIFTRA